MIEPRQSGMLSTELAILMPIIVLLALLAVFFAQVAQHTSRTQAAADSAARAAALTGIDGPLSEAAARSAAKRVCRGPVSLDLDWTPYVPDRLRPGRVVVDVVCRENFEGFARLIAQSDRDARATGVAAIEYWRSGS